ncbi:hypothetical protein JG687_00008539 [Phytophthora cactorum]|uniref:Uncharacterized protein n=1 Tax=Phytophthora cactorum TaxID=29920 RepID=A0A8T1UH89_9STRA|nr:hypothetical protein JG687_00008539 [Phytophthora cactorum]
MPKEHTRRGRPPPHLIDPQLLYPAGCSKERAVKVNGGLHWLCENHRDHQKALQRERYRRIAKEKKAKKHDKEPMPTGPTKSIQSLGGIPETLRSREKGQVAGLCPPSVTPSTEDEDHDVVSTGLIPHQEQEGVPSILQPTPPVCTTGTATTQLHPVLPACAAEIAATQSRPTHPFANI